MTEDLEQNYVEHVAQRGISFDTLADEHSNSNDAGRQELAAWARRKAAEQRAAAKPVRTVKGSPVRTAEADKVGW